VVPYKYLSYLQRAMCARADLESSEQTQSLPKDYEAKCWTWRRKPASSWVFAPQIRDWRCDCRSFSSKFFFNQSCV